MKWRWFERYWEKKPEWLKAAREAVEELWKQYKDFGGDEGQHPNPSSPIAIHDEWTPMDGQTDKTDQFKAYLDEDWAQVPLDQSPIPYWISKLTVWPQLA